MIVGKIGLSRLKVIKVKISTNIFASLFKDTGNSRIDRVEFRIS